MPTSSRGVAVAARHQAFKNYLRSNGGNATQAAISAGYSAKTAHVIGCQLLKRLKLEDAANERTNAVLEKSLLTQERVMKHLENILEHDPRKLYNPDGTMKSITELDDATARSLYSFDQDEILSGRGRGAKVLGTTYKPRPYDKLQAIDKAMRMMGMFERDNKQKVESVAISVNLVGAAMPSRPGDDAKPVDVDQEPTMAGRKPARDRAMPLTIDQYAREKRAALDRKKLK